MNTHPIPSPKPASTTETLLVDSELRTRTHPTALVGLKALADAVEAKSEEQDAPPLPDYLKNRWREHFSREAAQGQKTASEGFFAKIRALLATPQFIGYGVVTAALALTAVLMIKPAASTDVRISDTTRGQHTATGEDLPVLLITSDDGVGFSKEYKNGKPQIFTSRRAAEAAAQALPKALVADSIAKDVTVWQDGQAKPSVPVDALLNPWADLAFAVDAAQNAAKK